MKPDNAIIAIAQNEMRPLALSQTAAYIGTSWYRNWKLSDNIGILDIVKN